MPAPSATLTISRNGGSPASGGIACSGGDVIQLSSVSKTGWGSNPAPHWAIYGFPPSGFSCPAGWTDDTHGSYFYDGMADPPPFTLPSASSGWGKFMLGLYVTVGGGAIITDESTALSVPSPVAGFLDLGWRENKQFDAERQSVGDQQRNLRILESTSSAPAGTTTIPATPQTTTDGTTFKTLITVPVQVGFKATLSFHIDAVCTIGTHGGETLTQEAPLVATNYLGVGLTGVTVTIPATDSLLADEMGGLWATSITPSGSSIVLAARGIAAQTIKWNGWARVSYASLT